MIRLISQTHQLAVCRLAPGSPLAPWMRDGAVWSITRTPDELSVVVESTRVPAEVKAEGPFSVFMVAGPLAFTATGVLSRLTAPLAAAGIPVFVLSTYDTDYVLVPTHLAGAAASAWADTAGLIVE